jgi:hypothetical protein
VEWPVASAQGELIQGGIAHDCSVSGRDVQMLDLGIGGFVGRVIVMVVPMAAAMVGGIVLVVGGGIDLLRAFDLVLEFIVAGGDIAGLVLPAAKLAGFLALGGGLGDGPAHQGAGQRVDRAHAHGRIAALENISAESAGKLRWNLSGNGARPRTGADFSPIGIPDQRERPD